MKLLRTTPIVEVRVPTYRRPDLLDRALRCLQVQTWQNWRAVVFDDSDLCEGREVVEALGDSRILYRPNPARLGAAGNLDQCFSGEQFFNGEYAFVLEDDNGVLPHFIEANVAALHASGATLLLRNQWIYEQQDLGWRETARVTKHKVFRDTRLLDPMEVRSLLFFGDCISNGGLFWDVDALGDSLMVGAAVEDAGIQELCRTAQVAVPLLYVSEPLGIWTQMPTTLTYRSADISRGFGRALQSLQVGLLDEYGSALVSVLRRLAREACLRYELDAALAGTGSLQYGARALKNAHLARLFFKGVLRRVLVDNPIKGYYGCRLSAV